VSTERRVIRVGEIAVQPAPGVLATLGLGSCVAIVLHDPVARVGAMAHVLLPAPPPAGDDNRGGRYAATAPAALLGEMAGLGASASRLRACLVGGAAMFTNLLAPGTIQVGQRNLVAAREALRSLGIEVAAEASGGGHGRNVTLDTATGEVLVTSYAHATERL
jgi:chemotaxis protein CheD